MAKWQFEGNDRYIEQLRKLNVNSEEIIKRAVYSGAGLVADAIKQGAMNLHVDDKYHKGGEQQAGPREYQRDGLVEGFGISHMKNDDGFINVKLGFAGRNDHGEKNAAIARQVESGTSWMAKQPFIRQASNSKKKACEEEMARTFDEELEKLVG